MSLQNLLCNHVESWDGLGTFNILLPYKYLPFLLLPQHPFRHPSPPPLWAESWQEEYPFYSSVSSWGCSFGRIIMIILSMGIRRRRGVAGDITTTWCSNWTIQLVTPSSPNYIFGQVSFSLFIERRRCFAGTERRREETNLLITERVSSSVHPVRLSLFLCPPLEVDGGWKPRLKA